MADEREESAGEGGVCCENFEPNNVKNRVIEGCNDSNVASSRLGFLILGLAGGLKKDGEDVMGAGEDWSVRRTRLRRTWGL